MAMFFPYQEMGIFVHENYEKCIFVQIAIQRNYRRLPGQGSSEIAEFTATGSCYAQTQATLVQPAMNSINTLRRKKLA